MWKFLLSLVLAGTCSAQVFSPEIIGGLIAPSSASGPPAGYIIWLHADDPTGLFTNVAGTVQADASSSVGKFIGKWQDRSPSGTNSVFMDIPSGTFERRPVLSNSVAPLNNKPAIIFGDPGFTSEERTWLQTATNNITLGATGMTAFIVSVKITFTGEAGDSFPMMHAFGAATAKAWELRVEGAAGGTTTNIDTVWNGATTTTAQGFRIGRGYCWTIQGDNTDTSNLRQWRNGLQATSVNLATDMFPAANGYAVGSRWISAARDNCWHGAIAEAIVYPWALSSLEVSNVNFYCTNKYDLHDP